MPEEPRNNADFDGLSTDHPEPGPGPDASPTPDRWCLLRHDLPDGSWHLDLMIAGRAFEPGVDPARPLFTLRLPPDTSPRPNDPDCQRFLAERIGDHRAVYLDYEGPIAGGRGRVARIASGAAGGYRTRGDRHADRDAQTIEIELDGIRYCSVGAVKQGLTVFERVG